MRLHMSGKAGFPDIGLIHLSYGSLVLWQRRRSVITATIYIPYDLRKLFRRGAARSFLHDTVKGFGIALWQFVFRTLRMT
jgi:hypothetical protein